MLSLKKLSVYIILTVALPVTLLAQDDPSSVVVGKVAGENITYGELLENYSINTSGSSPKKASIKELEHFLPIYLDYRAKILAGKELGYHQDSALVAEYNKYTSQAAYSYWLEKKIKPAAFEQFKERSELELKAFHILIAVHEDASESEINDVIANLKQAKAELENGAEPQKVDQKYSTVRNGRSMGGDIPWISAGRTVKEFEDQIFGLEPGEVSEPFRTQFGYHVVLLQDKRERIPSRLVRHIYVRGTNDSTSFQKISDAHQQLQNGTSWDQVVTTYSEDRSTIQNGGLIGWINHQVASNSFIDTVMNIDANVSYTDPKETNYGYHIFRVDSVENYPNEAARDNGLKKQLEQTPYYDSNNSIVIEFLEKKFDRDIAEENIVELTKEHYPDFEQQAKSFLNGLIVFKLNEEQLWDPATADTTRLRSMYNSDPSKYQYPERSFYYLLSASHDSILNEAIQFVHEGGNIDSLKTTIEGLRVSSDSTSASPSEPFERLKDMETETFSNKFDYNNNRGVFWLEDRLEARKMTFDEAFSQLLNEYQPQKEQEWMERLREKFNVVPNYNQLREAYQKDS